MSTEKHLRYRGEITAIVGVGSTAAFVTRHPEGQPSALWRIDTEKLALASDPLPCGAVALLAIGTNLWISGDDGQLYKASAKGGKLKAVGPEFESPAVAMAPLSDKRVAVLASDAISVLSRKDGSLLQTLELPGKGSALASDPSGKWLVAGTTKGAVAVFECEEKDEFAASETETLHQGAVTSLLFEPEELRFLSAGADQKLLLTHARGQLEPEDRGRGAEHGSTVPIMLLATGLSGTGSQGTSERFYSGGRDESLKAWPVSGKGRPATMKDGVGKVIDMAIVEIHKRPHLVVAAKGNSLRIFPLDSSGKIGERSRKISDAYAWADDEFSQADPKRRETALQELAGYDDEESVKRISRLAGNDDDHALRVAATKLLAKSQHPQAPSLLEKRLSHKDEAIRRAAFAGLRKLLGDGDFRPIDLALKASKADVGVEAVRALESLAKKDDQALHRLENALDVKPIEVRRAALASLEIVHGKDSPDSNLLALKGKHDDVRRLGLIRLFQRKMLGHPRVLSAIRWRQEDREAEVRQTAVLVSLFTRDKLATAVRARDLDLHRRMWELESFDQGGAAKAKPKALPKQPKPPGKLSAEDYDPLLQAAASRALDTCLLGARCLALLGDSRAFGMLLQLSRENETQARVEVCRAFSALEDPRGVRRLRSLLHDEAAEVRDAAFSALARLHQDDPLSAAEAGLKATHEDVRGRALQALIQEIKRRPPQSESEPGWRLLQQALNDSFEGIRAESFKAAINLQFAGGGAKTLRFVLGSVHEDVRREVLTEVMAQFDQSWSAGLAATGTLLVDLFDDPAPKLRQEAFAFAVKKTKGKDQGPLQAGLRSRYSDVRFETVRTLIQRGTKAAQAMLVQAVEDDDMDVRQAALQALVSADAEDVLIKVLESNHLDARLKAAAARARHGDQRTLDPLLVLAAQAEPDDKVRRKAWVAVVAAALNALAELGDPAAMDRVVPLLQSKHAEIRKAAASALVWISRPDSAAALRAALRHDDPEVKYRAALGLALCRDPLGASILFSDQARGLLPVEDQLTAAFVLGELGEDRVVTFLDDDSEAPRNVATTLLLLREMVAHDGSPQRCLACLSSRVPQVRLTAAAALESFADPGAFLKFCGEFINDQGDDKPWTIPTKTIAQVAELLEHAEPRVQARTARLLRKLNENKQNAWNLAWEIHRRRFAEEIPALEQAAKSRQPAELQYGDDDLRRVAFGGYVGLIREQGSARWISPEVMRVRQTALRRAAAMAAEDKQLAESARPVFIQTLGDPQPAVRIQAFEQLQALGMDEGALGAEALETGHTDLGVRGLKFLTEGAAAEQANQVLEGVMLHRNDDLSIEAAKLLIDRTDRPSVAGLAVGGVFQALRGAAMHWLSMDYAESNPAKEIVRKAARSRHRDVRMNAACLLAEKKDPAAFDGLVELLKKPGHYGEWNALIDAFQKSEDPRSTDALIDRVENDPENDAPVDDLIEAAGSFRLPESVDRLLPLMGKKKLRYAACQAVKAVAGYDQYIAADTQRDADAPDAVPDWEQEQRPRRDDLFIRLIERCAELNAFDQISEMMEDALWCRSPDIDPILAKLSGHPEAWFRHEILATIGWRLRNRKGPADALLQALEHSEPDTKFAAAEALAKSRRAEGISVLLAAIELMESEYHRQRAVVALGVLADDRALEVLLKIAADDDHPLQDEAAEAIGHLGESDRAEEIFQLLKQFSKGSQMLAHHALRGLRWFNSPSGWNLIRKKAADPQFGHRETAVDLLESNDDPATRDLLLKLIKEDEEVGGEAFDAARTRFGEDSLEPDYARLQQQDEYCWWGDEALDRVCEKGDPKRILELLPRAQDADVDRLTASLLSQETPPVAEAAAILDSPHEKAVEAAAHLLGRGGKPAAAHKAALETALGKWTAQWEQRQEQLRQGKTSHDRALRLATDCLKTLIWAAGRLNVAGDAVLAAAESHADDVHFRPARLAALSAITEGKPSPAALSILETAAVGNDPEIRSLAAGALGKFSPKTAEKIAGRLVSDRVSLRRLASGENVDVSAAMRDAAARVHYQGAALPELLAQADAEGLRAVMTDHELPQATRLGGLEGLAKLASEPAETMLVEFAQSQDDSEELRKAAWRGLRRSQRARKKNAAR